MKLIIDNRIFETFEGLNIGIVIAKNIDNHAQTTDIWDRIKERQQEILRELNSETLSMEPKIDCWRRAYTKFGGKPKENRSSIENLCKMILKGSELRPINSLVDIYNYISLKYVLPAGGEDLDKIKGEIHLTFATENESEVALLGEKEARKPHAGEVIYKDNISAICRRWNWKEADRTKLTNETKNAILVVEGLPPTTKNEIEMATTELSELIAKYCHGSVEMAILNEQNPKIEV
ncbi:hypothetical protein HY990_04905 [Candidatus Micrarchaeota archaeon]|nr:hypothetical protein [Candidatus Micrarchaeota archaeon]